MFVCVVLVQNYVGQFPCQANLITMLAHHQEATIVMRLCLSNSSILRFLGKIVKVRRLNLLLSNIEVLWIGMLMVKR